MKIKDKLDAGKPTRISGLGKIVGCLIKGERKPVGGWLSFITLASGSLGSGAKS